MAQHGALCAGAHAVWLPRFDAAAVLEAIDRHRATIFMGVPTYYHRLLQTDLEAARLDSIRLFTSGSAGLPATDWHAFRDRTGHAIVERYGMTEIGMALSNPLHGERRPGHVGAPLPTVEVRLDALPRLNPTDVQDNRRFLDRRRRRRRKRTGGVRNHRRPPGESIVLVGPGANEVGGREDGVRLRQRKALASNVRRQGWAHGGGGQGSQNEELLRGRVQLHNHRRTIGHPSQHQQCSSGAFALRKLNSVDPTRPP